MNYYKDKKSNAVYAYDDEQLAMVARVNELELLVQEKEPEYLAALEKFNLSEFELKKANEDLNSAINLGDDEKIHSVADIVEVKDEQYVIAQTEFDNIESEYQPLKLEYSETLPVIFEIRENIKVMKKMSAKEVDTYLNPPVSKEQLIQEAEQRKQSLLTEAAEVIAPLQYAVDLNMATEEEKVSLTAWKKYSVLLNRVDTSTEPDIEWPVKP
ncbi:Caudovirales tail fibre assembly protein [Providencia rettgeri]|nr:tail fiber assembly protein [Providencia rettgeri]CAB5587809.1 Caudovirales tail fibre assembly protein [Providencia rettgeri]CAC9125115.1 Caudovirales tail fibre assembly protein [Providencia rettgeri]